MEGAVIFCGCGYKIILVPDVWDVLFSGVVQFCFFFSIFKKSKDLRLDFSNLWSKQIQCVTMDDSIENELCLD